MIATRVSKTTAVFAVGLFIGTALNLPAQQSASAKAAMDLVWEQGTEDPNGFPQNPQWFWEVAHTGSTQPHPDPSSICAGFPYKRGSDPSNGVTFGTPPCVSQSVTTDYPFGFNDFICSNFGGNAGKLHGHVDWQAVRYDGKVSWKGFKPWYKLGDGDYNLWLFPRNSGGLTVANKEAISLEFDSHETINHFGSPWWKKFHQAVDNGNPGPLINGKYGIAVGLLGIDTEHEDHSELHPVYALAIHDQTSQTDDVWAIFVRNWGNEGYCSQNQHFLNTADNQLTLFLPAPQGMSHPTVTSSTAFQSSGPSVVWSVATVANGVLLTVTLGSPQTKARLNGELHLSWVASPLLSQILHSMSAAEFSKLTNTKLAPQELTEMAHEPEALAFSSPPQGELTKIESQLRAAQGEETIDSVAAPQDTPSLPHSPFDTFSYLIKPFSENPAEITTVVDEEKRQRDTLQAQAICKEKQQSPNFAPQISISACKRFMSNQNKNPK